MQEPPPHYQPSERSDVYFWFQKFHVYRKLIQSVSNELLDRDWRQIEDEFIRDLGSELRDIIKNTEDLKRSGIENVNFSDIDRLVQALSNAIGKLYEFSDLKNAPDSQSKTSYYTKINECREHLSSAENWIDSILQDLSSTLSADPPVANNQASGVDREQITEQPSRQSTSSRTRKKAGKEDQSSGRQPPSANTEIELPIEKEGSSPSDAKSSSFALLEEQEHNNVPSRSLQDIPAQTGGNDVPLTRRDVESLLQAAGDSSRLKLNLQNLRGIDLRDFNLAGADLGNADLTEAILRSANLQRANLQTANMRQVNLRDADLQGAMLQGAMLQGAMLQRAMLQGAELQGVDLSGASLRGANLQTANMREANLRDAELQEAKLQGVDLSGVDLSEVNLSGVDLSGADLFGAPLVNAKLQGALLQEADLREADLREADLQGADLVNADLRDADLRDADLREANLFGAKLEGVSIYRKDIEGIVYLTQEQMAGLDLQAAELDNRELGSSDPNEALSKKPDTVSSLIGHPDQTEVENAPHDTTLVEKTEDHEKKLTSESLLLESDEAQSAPERSNEPLSFPPISTSPPLTNDEGGARSSSDQNQHQLNGNKDSEPRAVLLEDEVGHVTDRTHRTEDIGEASELHGTRAAQSIGTDKDLSREDVGAPGILARPLPIQHSDPMTISIRQLLWPSIVESIKRVQDDRDTQTLDIHITPSNSSLEAEKSGEKLTGQDRRYEVVLQFLERKDGQLRSRSFEGPMLQQFLLNLEDTSLGPPYGKVLHDALFHNQMPENVDRVLRGEPGRQTLLTGFQRALARSEDSEGLRCQLRINTSAPEMHHLNWEYLWDPEGEGGGPLACNPHTPFARVLHVSSQGDRLPTITVDTPIRILAALASPTNLDSNESIVKLLQPGASLAPIEPSEIEAFKEALSSTSALISPLEGENLLASPAEYVSLDALLDRMNEARREGRPFHVLHVVCHGLIRKEDGKSFLVLQAKNSDQAQLVPEDLFAQMLVQFVPDLRLVVLASCLTALPMEHHALQGVARRLLDVGIPAVIAMQDKIEIKAAKYFSHRLYEELASHGVMDRAVNAARRKLFDLRQQNYTDTDPDHVSAEQWGIPVLFMRLPDGKLFDLFAEGLQPHASKAGVNAIPPEQSPSYSSWPAKGASELSTSNDGADQLQLLTSAVSALVEGIIGKKAGPPPLALDTQARLFCGNDQLKMRWALVQAAQEHRQHRARRSVLFLRGLARVEIGKLLNRDRLTALNPADFQSRIWSGGHLEWGKATIWDIVEGGPVAEHLLAGKRPLTLRECRTRFRGFDDEGKPPKTTATATHTGNLTWSDERHGPLLEGRRPPSSDLDQLLYGQGDTFALFQQLTVDEEHRANGIDECSASLMLHAVYPDRYVPYHPDLASSVLSLLDLGGDDRFSCGFEGYCHLAHALLLDDALGFERLADVGYFLQRLADQKIVLRKSETPPDDLRPELRTVNLIPDEIDSKLIVRTSLLNQAMAALNAGKHIILIGPPGTGKTTLAEDLCRHAQDQGCNRGHILVTATADWTTFDTIGGYMPAADGQLVFQPGIFLEAIQAQKWLIIDEINRADIDKAFGELFTVLSGQPVTLPYKANGGQTIRILPFGHPRSNETHDYVIHPSWRIIGSVNIFDKASLFAMSFAFMRRFAFVDVAIPSNTLYKRLIEHFCQMAGLPLDDPDETEKKALGYLSTFFSPDNSAMRYRSLGPAIAEDVVRYLSYRKDDHQPRVTLGHVAEALLLYVTPQLDGLERENILEIYDALKHDFEAHQSECEALLQRIQELFPFIHQKEWEKPR